VPLLGELTPLVLLLFALESLEGFPDLLPLLAVLLGRFLGLLDLLIVELQLLLDARVAQQIAEPAAAETAAPLGHRRTGEHGQNPETETGSENRLHGVELLGGNGMSSRFP